MMTRLAASAAQLVSATSCARSREKKNAALAPGVVLISLLVSACSSSLSSSSSSSSSSSYEQESINTYGDNLPLLKSPVLATSKKDLDAGFHRKVYGAAGIGLSRLEPDTSEVDGVDVNERINSGGQITLGTDVNKWLSLELHTADLGSAGLSRKPPLYARESQWARR
ncbi:hypothetical protein N9850_00995 [Granulosicoccus sp.]|nr:hypothetical protein [Granulosicoccus sp.]MDB4222321.1 hypothetical protein [Granulosicoccus sp.]